MAAPEGPHILVVDGHIPTPDRDGGSLRLFNLLTLLVGLGGRVTFVPAIPADEAETAVLLRPYVAQLRAAHIEVISAPRIQTLREHLEAEGQRYQVVMLSGGVYHGYAHIGDVRRLAPQASLWFDTVDLAYVREYRFARLYHSEKALKYALDIKRMELAAVGQADWTLVVSQAEAEVLARAVPRAKLQVLTNVHHLHEGGAPFEARSGLVFIGAYQHRPNMDGLRWFLEDVFPALRSALPGVRFSAIGANPPAWVQALAAPDVVIAGHVPDLGAVYNTCRLSIAPLRFGAGVKGKVLLSLGYGVPVVGTHLAAEGSYLVDGDTVRLADTAEDFARAIVEVYTQPDLWQRLARNGQDTVARHFSFDNARRQLRTLLAAALPNWQPAAEAGRPA